MYLISFIQKFFHSHFTINLLNSLLNNKAKKFSAFFLKKVWSWNRNRNRYRNFSKVGTGTGTITFQKLEPEPEP
jgi:hypothetical protein